MESRQEINCGGLHCRPTLRRRNMIRSFWRLIVGLGFLLLLADNISIAYATQNSAPPFPETVIITMYRLLPDGTRTDIQCEVGDTNFGCTAFCNNTSPYECEDSRQEPYPYSSSIIDVPIETYYLLSVLSQELNPSQYPEPTALHAQTVVARSYLGYYLNNPPDEPYNNSNTFQVFIPYKWDSLNPSAEPLEPGETDPCANSTVNTEQRMACDALASGNSIASHTSGLAAKAMFFADVQEQTVDATFDKPYLKSVQEPISVSCDSDNFGHGIGFSQEGAVRWSRGNQCARGGDETTAYPVTWDDYRQILAHYYTGIDILDAGGSLITPVDRWNLLWHDNFGSPAGVLPTLNNAQAYALQLQLQNTSVGNWAENEITLGYQWTPPGVDPDPAKWLELTALPALETGASTPNSGDTPLEVSVPAPCGTGGYTLHLDAGRDGAWFSAAGWLDARIDVTVQLSTPQAAAGRGYYADGLGALYYNDAGDGQWVIGGPITWTTFTAPHDYAAVEPNINFDTDTSPPRPGVNGTFWSAYWEGNLYVPQDGEYRFYLGGLDDGGRLKIDGATHIESWIVQGPHEYFSPPINLTQGLHAFRVEYAQGPGEEAGLSVCWEGPNFIKEVIGASGEISGQPAPTPFMTPTYPPPATPTSDVTPTSPAPTPWWGEWPPAENVALQDEPPAVREAYSNLLSRVRDEVMLPDPKGDAYIRLAYRHAPEITALLLNDASLRRETSALMLEVQPLLEEMLAGKADGARLSADWVKRALALMENMQAQASPQLKTEIRWWRFWLPRFENKNGREIWDMLPPRKGKTLQTEGSPEELILQSLSAEEAREFGRLLSRARDEVMRPSKGGEAYIALVYRYTPEVTALLLSDEALRKEAEALLLEAKPGVQFLLKDTKSEWRFSKNWIKRMDALLAALQTKSSPELRAEIALWQARLPKWADRTPAQVWDTLLKAENLAQTPTPTPTATP
ncbi:MAG: hypothetical protein DYG85_14415 [Chloroflexi bacterium CFX1]|nr:hypothetical protein [Chloroflexi bacterium CFX1]